MIQDASHKCLCCDSTFEFQLSHTFSAPQRTKTKSVNASIYNKEPVSLPSMLHLLENSVRKALSPECHANLSSSSCVFALKHYLWTDLAACWTYSRKNQAAENVMVVAPINKHGCRPWNKPIRGYEPSHFGGPLAHPHPHMSIMLQVAQSWLAKSTQSLFSFHLLLRRITYILVLQHR